MARSMTALLPRLRARPPRRHKLLPPPELRRTRRTRWLIAAVAVAAVLFLLVSVLVAQLGEQDARVETGQAEQERDATAGQAVAASDPVLELCRENSFLGQALRDHPLRPCPLAQQVVTDPVPAVAAPRDGRDAPPPTPQQIQAAVRAELALNPPPAGRTPTAAEVAAIVAQFLTANPPDPGRPPTAGEIESAVTAYFAANPVTNGIDGDDGEPGRPPTAEEIQAAVAAELAMNPPRMGDQGVQGVGVQSIRAEERDGTCVLVFVLANPADGSTTEQAVPVSDRVCQGGGLAG